MPQRPSLSPRKSITRITQYTEELRKRSEDLSGKAKFTVATGGVLGAGVGTGTGVAASTSTVVALGWANSSWSRNRDRNGWGISSVSYAYE